MIFAKPWQGKLLAVLGLAAFAFYLGLGITGYVNDARSRADTEQLKADNIDLKRKVQSLDKQNQALNDQIGDCNARMEALSAKFHAPAHFKRGISENLKTTDSVTSTPKP